MLIKKVLSTSKKSIVIGLALLLSLQGFFVGDLSKVEAASSKVAPINYNIIEKDTEWTGSEFILGDLYIAPGAELINSGRATITGNIFVLGTFKNGTYNTSGALTYGTIQALREAKIHEGLNLSPGTFGSYNGTMRGGGVHTSNNPIKDLPLELDRNKFTSNDGIISSIHGATIPVMDLSIEGKNITLNSDGTFETGELDIGNKTSITFTLTDIFNNTITKNFPVEYIDTIPPTVEISKKSDYLTKEEKVSLTISEPGTIYYTTDGSEPVESSKVYAEAIIIKDNTTLKYLAIDKAGNKSEVYSETYMFLSINELTDKDKYVTGKAYPESTIKVVAGAETYTGKAEADGTFQIEVSSLSDFQNVKVSATSEDGIESNVIEVNVLDTTAPDQPTVKEVTDQSKNVEGKAEAGSTVSVKVDEKEIGSGTTNAEGHFSIAIPVQKAGALLKITATDAAGNVSKHVETIVIDVTPPEKPVVNRITDFTTKVTGTAEANSKITVKKDNEVLGNTETDSNGDFVVEIVKQKINDSISVTATDKAGNESNATVIKVEEVLPPAMPEVNEVTDQSLVVTGTGEVGSTIVIESAKNEIGRTKVAKNGKFEVTLKKALKANTELTIFATNEYDKNSGNVTIKVVDVTPPERPVVNEVGNLSTAITGTAEAGSTVKIKVNDKIIAKGKADQSGKFSIKIATQAVGTILSVTATDVAGNVSKSNDIEIFDSKVREKTVSKLGHISSGSSSIYVSPDTEAGKESSEKYKNSVYYIKKQATYKGELFYLLSNNASATKGTIGWMKASNVSTHTHKGVDSDKKIFYVKGTKGSSYSRAWGGEKNKVYSDLSKLSNEKFIVNKTEKVGGNTWYRGELNGKETFIHSSYLYSVDETYKEKTVSLLGHIKAGKSQIYESPVNLSVKESSETYKNSVYYIKKQATYAGNKFYLLSTEPSATKGTIGWINAKDLSTHAHKGVSKKKQTLYIQGTDHAYDKAWGGTKNIAVNNLPKDQPTKFEVDLVEKVGNNTWYRGQIDGKRAWVHSSKVSEVKEEKTSRLGHIRSEDVQVYKELGNVATAIKAGTDKTNQVYYIKKQAKLGKETHYLIATSPSSTKDVVGWVNAKDLSTHTHKGVSKKKQTLYIQGTDHAFDKAWGGSKNIVVKDLPKDQPTKFEVDLIEKIGNNTWYRGQIDGKRAWVHSSKVSEVKEEKTSRLGHIRSADVQVYSEFGNATTANKAGSGKTNQVYYIKKQAKLEKETYYLIATSPSSTKNVIGWVNAKDLSTHAHKGIDKKVKNLTIKGSGKSYSKIWGGAQDIVVEDLSKLKGKVFKVNLTETVGKNIWYRGKIDGKQMWIHNSYVK